MFTWFRRNKEKRASRASDRQEALAQQARTDEPGPEPIPDAETEIVADTQEEELAVPAPQFWNSGGSVEHWVGQMYNEELKKGAFDQLPGKGKPFEVPTGDITNSILKNANVLPDWLMLQHEIRDQLHELLSAANADDKRTERELDEINKKIKKYNTLVPSIVLQKRKLTKEDMRKQYNQWA